MWQNNYEIVIKQPSIIDQGYSSLCGPAVFIYCLAKRKPKLYVRYIIDLYENGEATIGRLKVKPSADCKQYSPTIPKAKGKSKKTQLIPETDWIGLAGLRDSENDLFDYDNPKDQFSGITMPGSIAKWFASSDFSAIRQKTNTFFDESLYSLLQAHKNFVSGACVCLFVGAKVLQGFPKGKSPADHWVVLNSIIRINGKSADTLLSKGKSVNQDKDLKSKKIEFSIYTWGQENYQINSHDPNLTVGKFLDYYYGYVAAQ